MIAQAVTVALQTGLVLIGCVLVAIGATWTGLAAVALAVWGIAEGWGPKGGQ